MKVVGYTFLMFISFALGLCLSHNLLKENETVVKRVNRGGVGYKYEYDIKSFPSHQCYYTDSVFSVGDTLIFVKK